MVVYALDGCIFLLIQSWLSVGFHVFALAGLYGGYKALTKLKQAEQAGALQPVVEVPQYAPALAPAPARRNPHYWRNLGLLAGILLIPIIGLTIVLLIYLP